MSISDQNPLQHSASHDAGTTSADLQSLHYEWLRLPMEIIQLRAAEDRARTWIRANELKSKRIAAEARRTELDKIFNPAASQNGTALQESVSGQSANAFSESSSNALTLLLVQHKLPIREAIRRYGLEKLRGRPVFDAPQPVFISDASLDDAIALWHDEPQNANLHSRFYGAETYNANLVRWIYSSSDIQIEVNYASWLASLNVGDLVDAPCSEDAKDVVPMIVKRIDGGILWLLPDDGTEDIATTRIPCCAVSGLIRGRGIRITPTEHPHQKKFTAPIKSAIAAGRQSD